MFKSESLVKWKQNLDLVKVYADKSRDKNREKRKEYQRKYLAKKKIPLTEEELMIRDLYFCAPWK